MKKIRYSILLIAIQLICATFIFADGLIIPSDTHYPNSYLKNTVTNVQVTINGIIAETVVTQEFENEWFNAVNGVYSFPLPADARTTRLLYSVGDTLIDAVLKVQQQSTNPGTGEGGVVAEINKYMGSNALRFQVNKVPAYGLQTIELHYIQTLTQFNSTYIYQYPLNTSSLLVHPLDYLNIDIQVNSSQPIIEYDLKSHSGAQTIYNTPNKLEISYLKSKAYAATDIEFSYSVENSAYNVDLYSCKKDSITGGYFTMVGHPKSNISTSKMPTNMVFMLGNSSSMIGNKLDQSKIALKLSLDKLSPTDSFNIVLFNSRTIKWKNSLVRANSVNISEAKKYIEAINGEYGSNLQDGILISLNMLKTKDIPASVLVFTDGKSLVDPFDLEQQNTNKVGLFFIAIGNDIDRARLETIAALNYGFVTYLKENNLLGSEMTNVFDKISKPILKDVDVLYEGPETYQLQPEKVPVIFAGSDFIQSGRYSIPGNSIITIDGIEKSDSLSLQFEKEFSGQNSFNEISRKLWAKTAIDQLEAEILIYGEADSLKNQLIDLSLSNNIRCRYTAYTTDTLYEEPTDPGGATSISERTIQGTGSRIISNYPNPFVNSMVLKFYISEQDRAQPKLIKIYDSRGRFIKAIDVSSVGSGIHELTLFSELFSNFGKGIYIVNLEIDSHRTSSVKIFVQ